MKTNWTCPKCGHRINPPKPHYPDPCGFTKASIKDIICP